MSGGRFVKTNTNKSSICVGGLSSENPLEERRVPGLMYHSQTRDQQSCSVRKQLSDPQGPERGAEAHLLSIV